jgi:hypothetical protein
MYMTIEMDFYARRFQMFANNYTGSGDGGCRYTGSLLNLKNFAQVDLCCPFSGRLVPTMWRYGSMQPAGDSADFEGTEG